MRGSGGVMTPPPRKVTFTALDPAPEAPGIASETTQIGGHRWARVRYEPDVLREEWCDEGHEGFVLEGTITYEFQDGSERLAPVCCAVDDQDGPVGPPGSKHIGTGAICDAGDGTAVVGDHALLGMPRDAPEDDAVAAPRRDDPSGWVKCGAVQRSARPKRRSHRIVSAETNAPEPDGAVSACRGEH